MTSLNPLLSEIEQYLSLNIVTTERVPGGDICQAYKLKSSNGDSFFMKYHSGDIAKQMFECEKLSLEKINQAGFKTPEVILSSSNFLLLEWIEQSSASYNWDDFAIALTKLHTSRYTKYGFELDGYIGLLKQSNTWKNNFFDFYLDNRIEPLINDAFQNSQLSKTDIKHFDAIVSRIENLIPIEDAVLIHGDLWSGNFCFSNEGYAYLFDASSSFNHRGFDLAMMKLFGGFPDYVFDKYEEVLPVNKTLWSVLELFMLYYLLIHLRLFGSSYYSSVSKILKDYA